jgi:hypothetical protein
MLDGAGQSIAYIWLGKTISNIQSKLSVGKRISEFIERDDINPSGGHVRRQSYFSRFTVVSRPSFMSKKAWGREGREVGSRRGTQNSSTLKLIGKHSAVPALDFRPISCA